jgi:hypothetical protein
MTSTADGATAPQTTHGCVRCGRPVPLEVALCDECNPLGLAQPAPAQAHGTVFIGIAVTVVILAVLAGLARSSSGPFTARIVDVVAARPTLVLTIETTNEGPSAGTTRCRVSDGSGRVASITTERISAGATVTFTRVVTDLGSDAAPPGAFTIRCDS